MRSLTSFSLLNISSLFKENTIASIHFLEKIYYSKKSAKNLSYMRNKIEKDSQKLYKEEFVKG